MPRVQDLGPGGRGPLPELRGSIRGRRADPDRPDGENPWSPPGRRDRPAGGSHDALVRRSRGHREAGAEPPPEPDRPVAADPTGIGTPNSIRRPKAPLPRTPEIGERGEASPRLGQADPARDRRRETDHQPRHPGGQGTRHPASGHTSLASSTYP